MRDKYDAKGSSKVFPNVMFIYLSRTRAFNFTSNSTVLFFYTFKMYEIRECEEVSIGEGLKHEGITDFISRNAQRNFAPGSDNLSYAPGVFVLFLPLSLSLIHF